MNKSSSNIKKILLSLILVVAVDGICNASNILSQLDITQASLSDSSLDVVLYTSSPYSDSVAVTKKSDDKYVILMPNVTSSQAGKPNLNGVKNFVSDVDIKSVNDGNGGYTKVTLTTTKPLNIRTKVKNTTPLTPEQQAYKSLITKSRTNPDAPVYIPDSRTYMAKTVVKQNQQVQKMPEKVVQTKPVPENKQVKNIKNKSEDKIVPMVSDNKKVAATTVAKTTTLAPNTNKVATVNSKGNANETVTASATKKVNENVNNMPATDKNLSNIKVVESNKINGNDKVKPIINKSTSTGANDVKNFFLTLLTILVPIFGLLLLLKYIKKSVYKSKHLKGSFKENLADKPVIQEDYEHIINNSNLTWQEKYQQFVKSNNKNKQDNDNKDFNKYAVNKKVYVKPAVVMNDAITELEKQIDKLQTESNDKKIGEETKVADVLTDKENIEQLERLLHDSPEIEKMNINEDELVESLEKDQTKVYDEGVSISKSMSDVQKVAAPKKLKAFANKLALEETSRTKPLPKTREEIKNNKNIESKYVELGNFGLYPNFRSLEGGNLRVADLISKSNKFVPNAAPSNNLKVESKAKKSVFENDKGYKIATLEEFFSLPESNRATASSELSNKVAESLLGVKSSIKFPKTDFGEFTSKDSVKSDKISNGLSGLIVKSGVNLDDKKGLYVVNIDGQTALIGRIGNEIFVLKQFDKNIERPIQVRHDDANVYMVKADKYRSLVQVEENNMDVLVEL